MEFKNDPQERITDKNNEIVVPTSTFEASSATTALCEPTIKVETKQMNFFDMVKKRGIERENERIKLLQEENEKKMALIVKLITDPDNWSYNERLDEFMTVKVIPGLSLLDGYTLDCLIETHFGKEIKFYRTTSGGPCDCRCICGCSKLMHFQFKE